MPRGGKICPQCSKVVGPRLRVCECGFAFPMKSAPSPAAPSGPPPLGKSSVISGPPPIRHRKAKALPPAPLVVEPAQTEPPPTGTIDVTISDPQDLDAFIDGLIVARDESRDTGGMYSSFCHPKGYKHLQVTVYLPAVRRK